MKVRALRMGYYDHVRRREGDVFTLKEKKGHVKDKNGKLVEKTFSVEDQFSSNWMEKVAKNTPEKVTSSPKALAAENAALRAVKQVGGADRSADADTI